MDKIKAVILFQYIFLMDIRFFPSRKQWQYIAKFIFLNDLQRTPTSHH